MSKFFKQAASYCKTNPTGQILRAFGTVATTNIISGGVGFLLNMSKAAWFGIGPAMDAFVIASSIPIFITGVLTSCYDSAVIPGFIQSLRSNGRSAAQNLLKNLTVLSLLQLFVLTAVLVIAGPELLKLLFFKSAVGNLELSVSLFYWIIPTLFMGGLIAQCSAILNAQYFYAVPKLSIAIYNLVALIFLWLLAEFYGIYALVFGVLLGASVQLIILIAIIFRSGIGFWPRWSGFNESTSDIVKQYFKFFIGAVTLASVTFVDQVMAAGLGDGQVAAFGYGNSIGLLLNSFWANAIGTAVLPIFSKLVIDGRSSELIKILRRYSLGVLVCTVPFSLAMSYWSDLIVNIVFQRGALSAEDAAIVASVQQIVVLQMPVYVVGVLGVRFLSAANLNSVMYKIALLMTAVKIVLNVLLIKSFGLVALAASTLIMYLAMDVLLFVKIYAWRNNCGVGRL